MIGFILVALLAVLLWSLKTVASGERTAKARVAAAWSFDSDREGKPLYPYDGHMEPPANPSRAPSRVPDRSQLSRTAEAVRVAERKAYDDRRMAFDWWIGRQDRLHALMQLREKWYGHEDEEL